MPDSIRIIILIAVIAYLITIFMKGDKMSSKKNLLASSLFWLVIFTIFFISISSCLLEILGFFFIVILVLAIIARSRLSTFY